MRVKTVKPFNLNSTVKSLFYLDLLHAKLNSHYEAGNYKKKKKKRVKTYRKPI